MRMKLRIDPGFLLSLLLMACASALAKPGFYASDVAGKSSECVFCDVDGDGFQDLVLMDDLDLSVFYQDINLCFTSAPRQSYRLEHRPCVCH
jgi:hypothetical protein